MSRIHVGCIRGHYPAFDEFDNECTVDWMPYKYKIRAN